MYYFKLTLLIILLGLLALAIDFLIFLIIRQIKHKETNYFSKIIICVFAFVLIIPTSISLSIGLISKKDEYSAENTLNSLENNDYKINEKIENLSDLFTLEELDKFDLNTLYIERFSEVVFVVDSSLNLILDDTEGFKVFNDQYFYSDAFINKKIGKEIYSFSAKSANNKVNLKYSNSYSEDEKYFLSFNTAYDFFKTQNIKNIINNFNVTKKTYYEVKYNFSFIKDDSFVFMININEFIKNDYDGYFVSSKQVYEKEIVND